MNWKEPKKKNILSWIVCVFLTLGGIGSGGVMATIMLLLAAVLACPIVRSRLNLKRSVWIPTVLILFFFGAAAIPSSSVEGNDLDAQPTSLTDVEEENTGSVDEKNPPTATEEELESTPDEVSEEDSPTQEMGDSNQIESEPEQVEGEETEEEQTVATDTPDVGMVPDDQEEEATSASDEETVEQTEESQTAEEDSVSDDEEDEIIVYITNTGSKYHVSGCRHLSESKIEITLSDAIAKGYDPCGTCHPPTE